MAFLYFDDSKHHPHGFSLGALVICPEDPSAAMSGLYKRFGYDPLTFEFKSSAKMHADQNLRKLRSAMKSFIGRGCKIAVCIVEDDKRLGPAGLELLKSALSHPRLAGERHTVYFDEGLFSSTKSAEVLSGNEAELDECSFHFEQDSRAVKGIQLADVVAHNCGVMLAETLSKEPKMVTLSTPGDDLYDGTEVELEFELWATIRYAFLSQNKPNPKDDFELAFVDVFPWGLFIDQGIDERLAVAAMGRFGENYLGCIH